MSTGLYDKQYIYRGRLYIYCHDLTEILLKVSLNTITITSIWLSFFKPTIMEKEQNISQEICCENFQFFIIWISDEFFFHSLTLNMVPDIIF